METQPQTAGEQKVFVTLDMVLDRGVEALTVVQQDEYKTARLGLVALSGLDIEEHKECKKDSTRMVNHPQIGLYPEIDEDRMLLLSIMKSIEKDPRSNFTFANKALQEKLGVKTAEAAARKLLLPGEIIHMVKVVQRLSGFAGATQAEKEDAVKNS